MLGRTLQFYIFKYFLKVVIYFVLGISALIILVDFTELNNRFSGVAEFTAATAFGLTFLRLPFIMQVALPFVILAATMATLMQLNKKNELVIARSVGVSAWQFLLPIWCAAFLLGCFAILVLNPVAATGFSKASETVSVFRGKPTESGPLANEKPWLRQDQKNGGIILIGAQSASGNGITLLDAVFIYIESDGSVSERYDAKRATLDDMMWILSDAQRSRAGEPTESVGLKKIPTNLDASVITQALIPAELISFFRLGKQISIANSFGVPANPYRMQYHSLLALPLLLISMTLIAATVSLRFARFGQSSMMILGGIIAGFVLYVIAEVTKSFGSAGIIAPVFAAWLPVMAASMFGVSFLLYREDG